LWDWDSNCGCSDEGYQEEELHGRGRMKVENLETFGFDAPRSYMSRGTFMWSLLTCCDQHLKDGERRKKSAET
jgi:hypothetical protein